MLNFSERHKALLFPKSLGGRPASMRKKKNGKINVHKVWTGVNPRGYVYSLSIYPPGTGLNKIVDEMDASLTNRAIYFLNALLIILFK